MSFSARSRRCGSAPAVRRWSITNAPINAFDGPHVNRGERDSSHIVRNLPIRSVRYATQPYRWSDVDCNGAGPAPLTLEEQRMPNQNPNQNPNQKPDQQQQGNPRPGQQPGQQQGGGGQKPGQQQ